MTLEQFAKKAGVVVYRAEYGRLNYYEKDTQNIVYCDFKTEQAAYKHWLKGTFGQGAGKAVIALLKESEKKK